ncbi:MAG: hypothetical protein JO290_10515 [Sphingomonadaceae bacterium]|nr:hypothetical protein [Sphingomonadaceae bacterium]
MDRATFIALASGLFGERWQTPLSGCTGIAPRTIRRMAAGDQPIPAKMAAALGRAREVLKLVAELTAEYGSPDAIDLTSSSDDQLTVWVKAMVVEALEKAIGRTRAVQRRR